MENPEEQVYLAVSNGDVERALQLIGNGKLIFPHQLFKIYFLWHVITFILRSGH